MRCFEEKFVVNTHLWFFSSPSSPTRNVCASIGWQALSVGRGKPAPPLHLWVVSFTRKEDANHRAHGWTQAARGFIQRISWTPIAQCRHQAAACVTHPPATLKAILDFLPHHTATALATSARKQHLVRLERIRRELLARSMPCVVVACKSAGYLELVPTPLDMRSTSSVVKFVTPRTVRRPCETNVPNSHPQRL